MKYIIIALCGIFLTTSLVCGQPGEGGIRVAFSSINTQSESDKTYLKGTLASKREEIRKLTGDAVHQVRYLTPADATVRRMLVLGLEIANLKNVLRSAELPAS